jgi:hypothetical protein
MPLAKNHLLKILVLSIILSGLLWLLGFYLAIDKSAFTRDHSALYHIFWLPFHILLAYFSILVYKKVAQGSQYKDISIKSILQDLNTNYRKVGLSILLIIPFMVQDLIEGYSLVQENFATMGNAYWVIVGPIWTIEWLMLAVIWSRVLATISLTVNTYTPEYVDEHLDDLLILEPQSPLLQAGVENALINLFYALSTIAYIEFTGGQSSDYQATIVSAALVLISFFASFFYLRRRVDEALERIVAKHAKFLHLIYKDTKHPLTKEMFKDMKLNFLLIDSFVLLKPLKFSNRAAERVSIIRASLLVQSIQENGYAEHISVPTAIEAMKYSQFEQKLASLGIAELQGVVIRLGSPGLMLAAKSGVF